MTDIEKKEKENFLRHAILVVDHCKDALTSLIERDLQLKGVTFEQFLNNNQHDIFHMCKEKICHCGTRQRFPQVFFKSQIELLFDLTQRTANTGILLEVLDMTLARCLLVNFCFDVFWDYNLQYHRKALEDFLHSEKHTIFHLWQYNTRCCHCPAVFNLTLKFPKVNQYEWQSMFYIPLPQPPCQMKTRANAFPCNSLCDYEAQRSVTVPSLSPRLQKVILDNCCTLRKLIERLIDIRNFNYGNAEKARMTDSDFETKKSEITGIIYLIGKLCGKEQEVRTGVSVTLLDSLDHKLVEKYKELNLQRQNEKLQELKTNSSVDISNKKIDDTDTELGRINTRIDIVSNRVDNTKAELETLKTRSDDTDQRLVMDEVTDLGILKPSDLEEVLKIGTYRCFWNRIFLVGQFAVGKSTLAKVLVGEEIPEISESTDGIWLYRGRAGMRIDDKQWIFLSQGNTIIDIFAGMFLSLKKKPERKSTDDATQTKAATKDDFPEETLSKTKLNTLLKEPNADTNDAFIEEILSKEHLSSMSEEPNKDTKESLSTKHLEKKPNVREHIEKLKTMMIDAIRANNYQQRIVPFDIWDFGGQMEFYMTHQLFITNRGVFVLIFNGSKDLIKDTTSMHKSFHEQTAEADYLLKWVNCILTFCPKMETMHTQAGIKTLRRFPRIIVVATHKDKVVPNGIDLQREKLQNALEHMFSSHSGFNHLEIKPLIFINSNDPEDPEIKVLRERLMDRAFEHPRWGEEMPTAWVPLEMMIAEKVEEGTNIISRAEMQALNEKNEVLVLNDPQLEHFLRVQHSLGKLLYFNDLNLQDYIIINPVFLIDLLRSLVTDQQFWPKDETLNSIFKRLSSTGIIRHTEILELWHQRPFNQSLKDTDYRYLMNMLVHLDILVPLLPTLTPKKTQDQEYSCIVPCMVQKRDDTNYLEMNCTNKTSIVLSYVFEGEVIPPALVFRFLASLISMYKIKLYQDQHMLFSDSVVVKVDDNHDVCVQIKAKQVVVYLVHKNDVRNIEPTLASSIQECLTASIHRVSEFYSTLSKGKDQNDGQKQESPSLFEIHFGVICVGLCRNTICFFHHSEIQTDGNKTWLCEHGTIHSVKELSKWFTKKVPASHCSQDCTGLGRLENEQCPLDNHLMRLAASITLSKCKEVGICLHIPHNTLEDWETSLQHQNPNDFKFKILHIWKQADESPSFAVLKEALKECHLSDHYLCNVFRDIEIPKEYNNEKSPTPYFLDTVSKHIGNDTLQLALELDLDISEIEQIKIESKNKLLEQTQKILSKWVAEEGRATNKNLVKALIRIGKRNSLKGVKL